jgi:dihydroxyacid dehydratase/phosphogluconate dehydratase
MVVLLTGCDKTTPSIVWVLSVDLPTIVVPGGPMLNGRFKVMFGLRFFHLDGKGKKTQ